MVRKTTKELLAESFKELAEQKPINKITIANIADNCGVTQPTFYRYYKDKYDLIAWIYVTDSEKIMGQIGSNGYIWKDTLLDAARYFSENRAFALNALRHTSGRDAFLNLLETVNTELLSAEVRKVLMTEKLPDDILTMIRCRCSISQSAIPHPSDRSPGALPGVRNRFSYLWGSNSNCTLCPLRDWFSGSYERRSSHKSGCRRTNTQFFYLERSGYPTRLSAEPIQNPVW